MSSINPPPATIPYGASYETVGAGNVSQPMSYGGSYPPTIFPDNSSIGNGIPSSFQPGPPSIDTDNHYFQYDNGLHEQSYRIMAVSPYGQSAVSDVITCSQNDQVLTAIPVSNELVNSGNSYQSMCSSLPHSPYNTYNGQQMSSQSPYNSYNGQQVSPSSPQYLQSTSPLNSYNAQSAGGVTLSYRDNSVYQSSTPYSNGLESSEGSTLYNVKPYTISMIAPSPVKTMEQKCKELMKETRKIIEARYKREWTSKDAKSYFLDKVQKKWNKLAVEDMSVEDKYMKCREILTRMMKCLDEDKKSCKLWRWVNGAQLVIDFWQIKLTKVYGIFSKGMNDLSYSQIMKKDESIKIYICIILEKYECLPGYKDPVQWTRL